MNFEINNASDREILIMVLQNQKNHITQHESLIKKVERIEYRIIEDIENRVRKLEDEKNKRIGAHQFWLVLLGVVTLINLLMSIKSHL